MDPVNVPAEYEVRNFTRLWDNREQLKFGEGHETQSWGRVGRRVSGMVLFERGLMTSYRHSIVTFPLSLPVSEILPFLCASAPIFPHPTSSLPKISPCSPGTRWMAFGPKERRCWANCPCNLFPRFPTNVITIHQRYKQTDRHHAISIPRYAHSALRGKNLLLQKWPRDAPYTQGVPKKEAIKLLAVTFSNLNRFLKFFHWQTQQEIFYTVLADIPPHLTYVATLPCETWMAEKNNKIHHLADAFLS